jgi:hypothetical protein
MNQELYEERYRIFKEKVIEKNHNLVAAFEAFDKSDCKSLLFIVVSIDDKKVYFFTKQNSTVKPNWKEITYNIIEEISAKWDDLSEDLINQKEEDIKCTGRNFYDWLVKDVLPTGYDRMCEVWIYCEDADIDPIWEWLYTDNIGFFGDDVLLIRVPRECEFNRKVNRDEDESVETLKFAVLHKPGSPEAYETPEIVRTCCKKYGCQYIDVYDREGLQNLIKYNYIHASLADLNDVGLYQDILEEVEINKGQKKLPCFLFLKVCSCCDEIREGVFGLVNPDVWLETSFDVKEDSFEKAFYREFCNTGDISKAILKARKEISDNFLRFAYVLKGNPIILREFLNYHS